MSGGVKKIDSIQNMALSQDFCRKESVRDAGNNVAEFKKIHILYGPNYSDKMTLSRIFRALETVSISDKYTSPEFQLNFDGGNDLPADLRERLGKHFNKESEELRTAIDRALASVENERQRAPNLIYIEKSDFYSSFARQLDENDPDRYSALVDSIKVKEAPLEAET